MSDQLFTSADIDADGRKLVLDDTITYVSLYDSSTESWDKSGAGLQSWYLEKYLPNDSFDTDNFLEDHWNLVDTPEVTVSTLSQSGGSANFGVERDEGTVGLSSEGLWTLSGDFEIRLYIDWSSYYNEYRSVTHSFLTVGKDSENSARVTFTFDGSGAFRFSSEKVVGKDPLLFDWSGNGDSLDVTFSQAQEYAFFKITRTSGVIKTFICSDTEDTQVGLDINDSVFTEDVYVSLGVETKELNTYRQSFTKFFVSGTVSPETEFFSAVRGSKQEFPDRSLLVIDGQSLSIIDYDSKKLWMRFMLGEGNAIPDTDVKAEGSNGTIYVTSSSGLLAFDFHNDKIYKYIDGTIKVSIDPIVLRNSVQIYKNHMTSVGTLLANSINDVSCKIYNGSTFLALATDEGVSVRRALASGIYNCTDGSLPATRVEFCDSGCLYWSGFDPVNNVGSLSYKTTVTALTASGTNTFSRSGYYSTSSALPFFGENVQCFDARTVGGRDIIAVGTSEGLTYIGYTESSLAVKSTSYGVEAAPENPVQDPSFEDYLGIYWKSYYSGYHKKFKAARVEDFSGEGTYSVKLAFEERTTNTYMVSGTYGGIYQDVDFTGVNTLYYDLKLEGSEASNAWNFQVVVGDSVVREYKDSDGPFTKYTDSADVSGFSGVHRLWFRLYVPANHSFSNIADRAAYIDNVRTSVGTPDYRVLPARNASIKEVLLQYDDEGHKIYFASPFGFGAVDVDDNSLDYFTEVQKSVPDAEILTGDFSRDEE